MSRLVVGIDLGTSHSLMAVCRGGLPRVLRNCLGEVLTPSVVTVEDGEVLVGSAAQARWTTQRQRAAFSFKRDMGTDVSYQLADRTMTPVELSACVLRYLKDDAEQALGRSVDEAVISVPAYFNHLQRRATHEAARLAGLHVERLINEPTAAAIAYGLQELEREQKVVVLDLGGGTFDVSVLEIIEGVMEVQASAGDVRLGGDDFTRALAQWVVSEELGESWDRAAEQDQEPWWRRALAACEVAKRRLSREDEVTVSVVDWQVPRRSKRLLERSINRAVAEHLWADTLQRIREPIARALRDARLAARDVDHVLLVGGSSRMPCFRHLAAEIFGSEPSHDLPADEVVALGAAVQASLKEGDAALDDVVVTDVAAFTLGVEVADFFQNRMISGVFSPILERGTVIPVSRSKTYSTVGHQQTEILLEVYQGEHPDTSKNQRLGELRVEGIPPAPAGTEGVDVRFSYDLNGVLEVEATVLSTGDRKQLVLEQSPGRLDPEEFEVARMELSALKFHPRDALPNTAALSKAEACFQNLRGPRRERVGRAISAFRAALEGQDEAEIEDFRDHLLQLVANVEEV